jgi:hypothetical protein
MILKPGDKVFITHRRMYEKDEPRYFVGEVIAYDAGIMKVGGFSFVRDLGTGLVIRKDEPRVKILSISSYAFLIYELPPNSDIAAVTFAREDGKIVLTDGRHLSMNLAEHPRDGHL